MKKSSLIIMAIALIFYGHSAVAQNFSIGPRLGVNFSTLVSDVTDFETNTALVFGVTSTYSFNEKTGLGIDLLYSTEGAGGSNNSDFNLGYIRVPILFQYFFRDLGDNLRPKVLVGLVPGFLTKAESSSGSDVKSNYNTFDLGATAGLGFHYQLKNKVWLNTDFRYMYGLSNIPKAEGIPDLSNQNFQLSVGVAFGLEK